jgi:hypothetical protein
VQWTTKPVDACQNALHRPGTGEPVWSSGKAGKAAGRVYRFTSEPRSRISPGRSIFVRHLANCGAEDNQTRLPQVSLCLSLEPSPQPSVSPSVSLDVSAVQQSLPPRDRRNGHWCRASRAGRAGRVVCGQDADRRYGQGRARGRWAGRNEQALCWQGAGRAHTRSRPWLPILGPVPVEVISRRTKAELPHRFLRLSPDAVGAALKTVFRGIHQRLRAAFEADAGYCCMATRTGLYAPKPTLDNASRASRSLGSGIPMTVDAGDRRRYSMTSSARAKSACGRVRPSACAVFRLMTSSNLVGCSTGSSEGFAPFRIFPAYTPICRYAAARLGP